MYHLRYFVKLNSCYKGILQFPEKGIKNFNIRRNFLLEGKSLSQCLHIQKKWIHSSTSHLIKFSNNEGDEEKAETRLANQGYFINKDHNRNTFLATVDLYKEREKLLRGHVEFIYAALKNMDEYGVKKDIEVYKKIMDVFPKIKMVPTNMWQVEFMHYPYHQQCAIDVLCKMEDNGVIPDREMGEIITKVFGKYSFPFKKYGRMVYWMNKFVNASPWPLPKPIPDDGFLLAKLAVERMCTVDHTSVITVYKTSEVTDSIDDTWIVSGQSPQQSQLLHKETGDKPLKVEGPFRIYLREACINYFILKAEYTPPPQFEEIDIDDISNISKLIEEDGSLKPNTAVTVKPSVHEQKDGVILAICVTGTSSRDSLLSWVRLLSKTNPRLDTGLAVVFTQASPDEGDPEAMGLDRGKEENEGVDNDVTQRREQFKREIEEMKDKER